jgi:hypothetical protein
MVFCRLLGKLLLVLRQAEDGVEFTEKQAAKSIGVHPFMVMDKSVHGLGHANHQEGPHNGGFRASHCDNGRIGQTNHLILSKLLPLSPHGKDSSHSGDDTGHNGKPHPNVFLPIVPRHGRLL